MEDEENARLVGLRNQRSRTVYFNIVRPSLVEFSGVFFLVFLIHCSGAVSLSLLRPPPNSTMTKNSPAGAGPGSEILGIIESLVAVFVFIGVFSFTRPISGGQLNPIITLMSVMTRTTIPLLGLCYILAQFLGAILGALCVKVITDVDMKIFLNPSTSNFNPGKLIFAEMMGSVIVYLAFLTMVSKGKANVAILGIGFGYAGALVAVHSTTLGFLNPVINFGISVAADAWEKHYIYWAGTALGGIIATLLHGLFFASPDQLWFINHQNMPERMN